MPADESLVAQRRGRGLGRGCRRERAETSVFRGARTRSSRVVIKKKRKPIWLFQSSRCAVKLVMKVVFILCITQQQNLLL